MEAPKDIVKLQENKLCIGDIVDLVVSPDCGAISTFIGTTRDNFEDKKVTRLEYEAYEPMALKKMHDICAKVRSQWNVERIAIYHRLGAVPVAEASVIIAISSHHRQESLQAVQFAIDTVKSSVPIWKKEIYDMEKSQWKENKECSWSTSEHQGCSTKDTVISTTEEFSRDDLSSVTETVLSDCVKSVESKNLPQKDESTEIVIDPNLVQVRASTEELNRRIESFIARKRQQVNIVNVQEFCCHRARNDDTESSCARVDAILIRRKDSKSHVKVHRVLNPWGPQNVDPSAQNKTLENANGQSSPKNYPPVLEERLATTEKIIGMNGPVPREVYQRLKKIEERILYLESLSPEYRHFWATQDDDNFKPSYKPVRKRTFSTAELDTRLYELENRYAKKIN